MTDRQAIVSPTRPIRRWRTIGLVAALILALAGCLGGGVIIGRATALGPRLVVVPGPIVQESPAQDAIDSGGSVDSARLTINGVATTPSAVFTGAPDLDDVSGTASGFRLSRSGLDGASVAHGLATVFGINDAPVRTRTGWTAGADHSQPSVSVVDDAAMSWSFTDPGATRAAQGGVAVTPLRARQAAEALLAGVGVDLKSVAWGMSRYDDHLAITAGQLLDGKRTSMSWEVNFGQDDSVVSASGFAAEFVEVPGYEVIGAATAVRRAGLPTWSLVGPTPVVDADAAAVLPTSVAAATNAVGPDGRPALQVDVASIVIVDAVLGLAQFWDSDGTLLVLPSYRLTGDDGSRWTLLAVTGDYVDFVDRPYPAQPKSVP